MRVEDESLFADLQRVGRPLRWVLVAARGVFMVSVVAGVITFILHWIFLMLVIRNCPTTPIGEQIYRITSHGDSRYVTHAAAVGMRILSVTMFVGLVFGMVGEAVLSFFVQRLWPKPQTGD